MVAVASGNRHNQRVIADLAVCAAPGRHIRTGIGPADSDTALVCSLPAIGAAAHPMVVVAQGYHTDAKLLSKLYSPSHGLTGI